MPTKNYFLFLVSLVLVIILSLYSLFYLNPSAFFNLGARFKSLNESRNSELAEINVATTTGTTVLSLVPDTAGSLEVSKNKTFRVKVTSVPANTSVKAIVFAINVPIGNATSLVIPSSLNLDVRSVTFNTTTNPKRIEYLVASQTAFALTNGTELLSFVYTAPATPQNVTFSSYKTSEIPSMLDSSEIEIMSSSSLANVTQSVVLPNVAPSTPTVSVNPNVITLGSSTTLTATATDSDGTISKVEFYYNNGSSDVLLYTDSTAPYSFVWTPTTTGNLPVTYPISVISYDNAGASSARSAKVNLVVNDLPTLPSPGASPSAGYYLKGDASVSFTNSVADVTYKYCIHDDSTTAPACTVSLANNTYSTPILIDKNMTILVYATKSGYKNSPAFTVSYDLIGDMNTDGKYTINDDLLPLVRRLFNTPSVSALVDVNKDGKFNIQDIVKFIRYVI